MNPFNRSPSILITGGAGYLGSELIRQLLDSSNGPGRIRVLDNLQREGYAALMDLPDGEVEFIEGDILDPAATRRALEDVDAVVHMAAIVSTPLSFDHPTWMEQVNHWGTAQLVERALESGVRRFIFVSSASVYGPGTAFHEEADCQPLGPYAWSKLQAERAVREAGERGIGTTILRMATVLGNAPVMRFDAVPNRMARLAGMGQTLSVFGTGEQRRAFIHVSDAARALRFVLSHPDETVGELFNVLGFNASVIEIVEAARQFRPDLRVRFTEQNVQTHLSYGMNGRKLAECGWRAEHSLVEGVLEVARRFDRVMALPRRDSLVP